MSRDCFTTRRLPRRTYSELLSLDMTTVEPSLAGPKRPQDRVVLSNAGESFNKALPSLIKPKSAAKTRSLRSWLTNARWEQEGGSPAAIGVEDPKVHEHVSASREGFAEARQRRDCCDHFLHQYLEPFGLIGAGLLAKKAVEKGLSVPPG